ncbi:MAG: MaoC family dehydratase [Acidimicrobiales bacterium]
MSRIELHSATARPIGRDDVGRFGDAVGDHNPVHFDVEFAKAAGLPDTVVHGPFSTAIVIDQIVAQVGAENLLNLDVRLRGPVFPGDELTITPIDFGEADRGVEVHNQSGQLIATAITIITGDPDA